MNKSSSLISEIPFPLKIPNSDYSINLLTKDLAEKAIGAMAKIWMESEPIIKWLQMPYEEVYKFLLGVQMGNYREGSPNMSVVLTDLENEVVGVSLCRAFNLEYEEPTGHLPFDLITSLYNSYRRCYKGDKKQGKVCEMYGVGVIESVRAMGLTVDMLIVNLLLANFHGYSWSIVLPSNVFSENIITTRFPICKIDQVIYEEYEFNGTKPFKGIDEFYTAIVNKKIEEEKLTNHNSHKKLLYTCKTFSIIEGNIIDMLTTNACYQKCLPYTHKTLLECYENYFNTKLLNC